MEQCHLQTQKGKEMRCQPAEPVVICTHLCLRTSFEPPREWSTVLSKTEVVWSTSGHRCVGGVGA